MEIKSFSFSVVKASCTLEDGFYVHVTLPPNETDSQDKGRLGMFWPKTIATSL